MRRARRNRIDRHGGGIERLAGGLADHSQACSLALEDDSLAIRELDSGDALEVVAINQITFSHYSEEGQLAFITTEPRSKACMCYVLDV